MFTDIVGSTELASELGDRRWKELLSRHHAIVRREIRRHGGREIDTAGDGFFAAFDRPAEAVLCACAITDAVRSLGIEVRAGLHSGECEVIGRKLGGITVHIAARVLGAAPAGGVLITSTLKDLVAGARFDLDDLGPHVLKGVGMPWQLWRVKGVEGVDLPAPPSPDEARTRREAIPPAARIDRRRGTFVGVGGLVVIAAVAIPLLAIGRGHGAPARAGGPSASPAAAKPPAHVIERIDPATGEVTATIALGNPLSFNGEKQRSIAVGPEGTIWVTNGDDGTITRIDPTTLHANTFTLPESIHGVAVGPEALWAIADGSPNVYRVDPATGGVVATIQIDDFPFAVAADQATGTAWAFTASDFMRIDPQSNRKIASIVVICHGGPEALGCANLNFFPFTDLDMAVGDGVVWLPLPNGKLVRLDEASNRFRILERGQDLAAAAVDPASGSVWVTATESGGQLGSVLQIDQRTGKQLDAISIGCCPGLVAVGGGTLWVTDRTRHTVTALSTVTRALGQPIRVDGIPTAIAVSHGELWVAVERNAA
jgi:streptogramin lyase